MRRPRITRPGAEYHVVARANRQEFILDAAENKDLLLQAIREARRKYSFAMRNFCIMGNHVHLMIKPSDGESISRIIQWILAVFAIRFNRRNGITGHVWYDRFKSKIIASFRQLVATFDYIMRNPVVAGLTQRSDTYAYGGVYRMLVREFDVVDPPDYIVHLILRRSLSRRS